LRDYEKDIIRKWIDSGAQDGGTISPARRIVAQRVRSAQLKQIYCFISGGRAFARVDVIDHDTGKLYFTDWVNSAAGWVNWEVGANGVAPAMSDVMLTLTPEGNASEIESLFVVDKDQLSEALKREYEKYVRFKEFPIKAGIHEAGIFTYSVLSPADVQIVIAPSMPNSAAIYEETMRNVPSGVSETRRSFGKSIGKGDYSARFTFSGAGVPQPAYSLLLHAE
jgi:hypothetical protein